MKYEINSNVPLALCRKRIVPAMLLLLVFIAACSTNPEGGDEKKVDKPPDKSEFKAMSKRLAAMKELGVSASVIIYPTRVGGDQTEQSSGTHLAQLLNDAGLCQSSAAETGPVLEGQGWPNELKVLWIFANAAQKHVRENPPDSDYVMFADYWFNPAGEVWAVHFVLCDRAGDWVIVGLQNSHQKVFRKLKPKTVEDCDRLVLECMKNILGASDR